MRRLLIKVSIVAFLFIAAGIITKLWLVPMAIRKGITFEMKHYWPGYVHIEGLKFSFRGRVTLGRILLTDNQGRNRFCFENTKAFLADVLRLNFKVKNIEIASADINLFLTPEDQETSLINFSESLAWLENSRFNITQLIIENVSVTLNKNEGKIIYENLRFHINKLPHIYQISLTKPLALELQIFSLEGTWDPSTKNCEFELLLKHSLQPEEAVVLTSLLGIDSSYRSEGLLDLALRLSQKPKELDPTSINGAIDFLNWTVSRSEDPLLQNLCTKVILNGNQCKFEDLKADMCKGAFEGSLILHNWKKKNESFYTGRFSGKQIDLPQLNKSMNLPYKITKGTMSFEYEIIAGNTNGLGELAGEGIVFIDDSDLYQMPVISHMFTFVGLKANNLQRATDTMVFFRNSGSVVTINKGQVANRFWAIRVQPGGFFNLKDKTVDMHVVAFPLGQIEDIIRKLPFAELFGKVKDGLARLRVKGEWSEPASKLVTKEPLTDIKEATVGFIRDIIDTGGEITEKMRKPFREMYNNKNDNSQKQ